MIKEIKNKLDNKFIGAIVYLLSILLLSLLFLAIFRLIFFYTNALIEISIKEYYLRIIEGFLLGASFDTTIICAILLLPTLVLPVLALFNTLNKKMLRVANIYIIICMFFVFAITVADIPYFHYFRRHIEFDVFQWAGYFNEVSGMILQDASFLKFFILIIVSFSAYIFILIKVTSAIPKRFVGEVQFKKTPLKYIVSLIVVYVFVFWNIACLIERDKIIEKSNCFEKVMLRQMTINPIFFIGQTSVITQLESWNDEKDVLEHATQYLGFDISSPDYYKRDSIDRNQHSISNKPNIVLVFVESLSSYYLDAKKNNDKPLIPFLKGLTEKSIYFDNFYSQGIHTNQGIVSTLYGFPNIFDKHMLMKVPVSLNIEEGRNEELNDVRKNVPLYHGLPNELRKYGYNTISLITHRKSFDNIDFFYPANGFDQLFGQEDYPQSERVNIWGVSDKSLMSHSLEKIDSLSQLNKPFFTSILTISNHPPFVYPAEFENTTLYEDMNAIAYADDCFRQFMEKASQEEWYKNTIFIFLGDHGKTYEVGSQATSSYEMPLSLTHIPLIIYSPLFENIPQKISNLGCQVDVYPTVMGLAGLPVIYNTYGIDLFKQERKYVFFSTGNKLACLDKEYYYLYDFSYKHEYLYRLADKEATNRITEERKRADSMRCYSESMIRSANYIFDNYLK